jgi:hypothetical protein
VYTLTSKATHKSYDRSSMPMETNEKHAVAVWVRWPSVFTIAKGEKSRYREVMMRRTKQKLTSTSTVESCRSSGR